MRYEEYIKKAVDEFLQDTGSTTDDFPEFELYMDQAVTFMNKKLGAYKKDDKDILLTRTMVNNYTKHKMIPSPAGKKYTRTHLILLTMIYHLKRSFQMDEIEKLMKPLIDNYNSEFDEKIDFAGIYSGISGVLEPDREALLANVRRDIEAIKTSLNQTEISDDDMLEVFMLITTMAVRANMQRLLAEKLLDEFFVRPSTQRVKKIKRPKIKFDSQGEVAPRKKAGKKTEREIIGGAGEKTE